MGLRIVIGVVVISLLALTMATGVVFANPPDADGCHDHKPCDPGGEDPGVALASIELLTCADDGIATWDTSMTNVITYRIENVSGVGPGVIGAIQAGIDEWNAVQGVYRLQQSDPLDIPDITIQVFFKIIPGSVLGAAGINCQTATSGIQSASILLGVKGLNLIGVTNVAAHEIAHTLGLGHADFRGDLLDPRFERREEARFIVCPSNLDVGGLTATTNPYSIPAAAWVCAP